MLNSSVLRWLQKEDDDENKSRTDREFQAAGLQQDHRLLSALLSAMFVFIFDTRNVLSGRAWNEKRTPDIRLECGRMSSDPNVHDNATTVIVAVTSRKL